MHAIFYRHSKSVVELVFPLDNKWENDTVMLSITGWLFAGDVFTSSHSSFPVKHKVGNVGILNNF